MSLTGKNIIRLSEVGSTNNYAKQLVSDQVENGTVVLAQFQSGGRGQAGKHWESEAGKNLLCSLILYPDFLNAGTQFIISKIVSLSIVELLEEECDGVSIKWPNDVYVDNRKIAGMLIENSVKGMKLDSSVIGIGLNVNQEVFYSDAPNPVSLKQITGKEYALDNVLKRLLDHFWRWYAVLNCGDMDEIDRAYFKKMFGLGEWRRFRKDGNLFEARIAGLGEFGQLLLEDRTGKVIEFMFKEVEFVL